jgi:hypothetical protein
MFPSINERILVGPGEMRSMSLMASRDLDLAGLVLLGLRDPDAENTVLHASLDTILIDAVSETKGASKLANTALRHDVLGLILWLLLDLFVLILSGDLSIRLAGLALIFDESVVSFDAAANGEGLGIGELNLNVLLLNPRKLAVQLVTLR